MSLSDNIKKYRKKEGLTQKQLAEAIGVTAITIQNYENARREPNIETLDKISKALKINTSDLFNADDMWKLHAGYFVSSDPIELCGFNKNNTSDDLNNLSQEDIEFLQSEKLINNGKLVAGAKLNITNRTVRYKNKTILLPISFKEMKKKVDKIFPALAAEIEFLSNPNVEKTFNYSFDDLARKGGYQELLILAIEKAIKNTLMDIEEHLSKGDIFDGVSSWITKESPLYDIIKNEKIDK